MDHPEIISDLQHAPRLVLKRARRECLCLNHTRHSNQMPLDFVGRQLGQILIDLGTDHRPKPLLIGLAKVAQRTRRRDNDESARLSLIDKIREMGADFRKEGLLSFFLPVGLFDRAFAYGRRLMDTAGPI